MSRLCPKCGSAHVRVERSREGSSECRDCGFRWPHQINSEQQAEIEKLKAENALLMEKIGNLPKPSICVQGPILGCSE